MEQISCCVVLLFLIPLALGLGFCRDRNEVFKVNGDSCYATCQHPIRNRYCAPHNVTGCFCKDGTIYDEQRKKCVDPSYCPKYMICPTNEKFVQDGPLCITTCQKPIMNYMCIQGSATGCYCKDGYIRDEVSERCVRSADCPHDPCKHDGEEYKPCGNCEENCVPPPERPRDCFMECSPGCFCKSGLLRDSTTGDCVLPEECPNRQCGSDESFQSYSCGEQTCDNPNPPDNCEEYVSGCFCKDGLYRNNVGLCVPREQCICIKGI